MDGALVKRTASVTQTQLETLVSFMEKHPNLATAKNETLSQEKRKALWFDLYVQLNAVVEGTQKTLPQWKKVWQVQKSRAHTKAMMLIETKGNSPYLTPLEERILKVLSLIKEFKSPEPSSDIFLIPDTGIVFSLPIVAQDQSLPSVSQDHSSTTQDVPDTPQVSQEIHDPILSESSNISVAEVLSTADEQILTNPEPPVEASIVPLSSKDIPVLIKQETEDKRNNTEKTLKPVTGFHAKSTKSETTCPAVSSETVNNPATDVMRFEKPTFSGESARPDADFPSSTTTGHMSKGRKRRHNHLRSHHCMTADKAAETFGYISERNCVVLERIASAMEAQASRAAKQTQLMREIAEIVKRK